MLRCLLLHTMMKEEHRNIATSFFMHRLNHLALAVTHDVDAAQRHIRCIDEMISDSSNTLCQTSHHLLTIESIIILHNHRRLSLMRTDEDAGLELGDVKFQGLNVQWRITYLIFVDNAHLIDEVNL